MIFFMAKPERVTVFCASSQNVRRVYLDAAYETGRLLAEAGMGLVTGGGVAGLMRKVQDGALDAGGKVSAILPQFMIDAGWMAPNLKDVESVDDMATRKSLLVSRADAVLVLPGGCGTLDELSEVLTSKQLGLCGHPVVILNTEGFYDHLLAQLSLYASEGFMKSSCLEMWQVASTPGEAVKLLESAREWDTAVAKENAR